MKATTTLLVLMNLARAGRFRQMLRTANFVAMNLLAAVSAQTEDPTAPLGDRLGSDPRERGTKSRCTVKFASNSAVIIQQRLSNFFVRSRTRSREKDRIDIASRQRLTHPAIAINLGEHAGRQFGGGHEAVKPIGRASALLPKAWTRPCCQRGAASRREYSAVVRLLIGATRKKVTSSNSFGIFESNRQIPSAVLQSAINQ